MLTAILAGFLLAFILLSPVSGILKGNYAIIWSLLPLSLFIYFLSFIPGVSSGSPAFFYYSWVPSAGVDLGFTVDGLSLLFCLLITGIGTLVFIYSAAYMKGNAFINRFFAYLGMFMASMLGLVLSDNVLSLFVFWELTSISSFLLIGFNHKNKGARKAAIQSLTVTGGGGFLLLVGFIMLGYITGSYSIREMLAGPPVQSHMMYGWLVFLILGGAFTKSAQFPFHFWLPSAMQAPAPVSTYLHSATMVKAGVYLLARFTPLLGNHPVWNNTLMIAGGITMIYAAVHTLFRSDLKSILAYSTVSALGILVFLTGMGTPDAILAMAVFILVHALYKAAFFLITGIIDLQTGIRDVNRLSGLGKIMRPVAIAGALAACSGAGIPLTFGFIGKELMYGATLGSVFLPWGLTGILVLTNILLLYAGFMAGVKPFTGKLTGEFSHAGMPRPSMWVPPLLLGIAGLMLGLFPALISHSLIGPVTAAMTGAKIDIHLAIWHGFNTVLLLSGITLAGGFVLYFSLRPTERLAQSIRRFDPVSPQNLANAFIDRFNMFAGRYTRLLENGYLRFYLLTILSFSILLLGYKLFSDVHIRLSDIPFTPIGFYEAAIFVAMLASVLFAVFSRSRLSAVVSMSVVGYSICLFFVFYGAPDLAMTQFTIDTLTVVLFVLVLYRLPPYLQGVNKLNRLRDGIVAIAFGTIISIIALQVLHESPGREISRFYGDNAYIMGKGKNVVNVILVDFRGLDTMVEITVLTIAAIGVYSLLKLKYLKEEK